MNAAKKQKRKSLEIYSHGMKAEFKSIIRQS